MAEKKNLRPSQRLQVEDMGNRDKKSSVWPSAHIAGVLTPPSLDAQRHTNIFLVLDRSGSMDVVCEATIEGINAFVQRAAASEEHADLTLTTFSTDFSVVVDGIDLREFRPIGKRDYRPSGGTALLDAFARTIALADARVIRGEVMPNDVLFVVMTDGEENASSHYTRQALAELVADREGLGYEFLYLGANQDSFGEAGSMGVSHAGNWESDEFGTQLNMERARRITSAKMGGRRVESMTADEIQSTAEDAAWVTQAIKDRNTGK